MRRRRIQLVVLGAVVVSGAVITSVFVVQRRTAARDVLAGVDVDLERESSLGPPTAGGAEASDRGPEQGSLDAAPAPSVSELGSIADPGRLHGLAESLSLELDAAETDAARSAVLVRLSAVHRQLGQRELALDEATRAVALTPADADAHHARARALAARLVALGREKDWSAVLGSLGDIGEYKGELAAVIRLQPTNVDAREEEIAVLLFAPWPVGDGRAARRRIEALAEHDALRAELWRAQALAQDDRGAEAAARVEALDPQATKTVDRHRVALVRAELLLGLDRDTDAIAVYDGLLATLDPTTTTGAIAVYQAAKARQRAGVELERALALLDAWLAVGPVGDFVPPASGAWYRKGLVLRDLGRPGEARPALERALELDPGLERASSALEGLVGGD
jgi:tetratricopeptide (TPR) repeat protein